MTDLKQLFTSKRAKKLSILIMVAGGLAVIQPFLWPWVTLLALEARGFGVNDMVLEEVSQAAAKIQQTYEKQKLLLEQMVTVVPREARTIQIIQRLEANSVEAGVVSEVGKITDEALASEEGSNKTDRWKDSGIIPLQIEMHSSGQPADLLRYLASLENLRELSQIREVRLNAPRGNNIISGKYQLDIEMTFYLSQ